MRLDRLTWFLGITLVACAFGATPVQAQCSLLPHGQVTGNDGWTSLVQTFAECTVPNTMTSGFVPACTPPVNPTGTWRLDPLTGSARVRFDAMNPTDVRIRIQLRDIRDTGGAFVVPPPFGGTGRLKLLMRFTYQDPSAGNVTVVDFPLNIAVSMTTATGDSNVTTTVNTFLLGIGQPALPQCSNVEILDVVFWDPSTVFLRPGHFRM